MINNLQITGVHSQLNTKLQQYIRKKVGSLDKYIPKYARTSTFVEVRVKEKKVQNRKLYECEIIMKLPKGNIVIKKEAISPKAAVDEVLNHIKTQLNKYKDRHTPARFNKHALARARVTITP